MIPALPLGHEPFGPELKAKGLEAEWRFRVIHERSVMPGQGATPTCSVG